MGEFLNLLIDKVTPSKKKEIIFNESSSFVGEIKDKISDSPNESEELSDKEKEAGPGTEKKKEDPLAEIFKKYNISNEVSRENQKAAFVGQVRREVSSGEWLIWGIINKRSLSGLVDYEKNTESEDIIPGDVLIKKIKEVEDYFVNLLGQKAKIGSNETINGWIYRITNISFEDNK